MNIGTLEIQLMADMARLKRDMDDAKGAVSGAMGSIENAVGMAQKAFAALGVGAAAASFYSMVKSSIDAAEALHDLSIQTGTSVESLSAMAEIGKLTGTSAETIGGAMNKLSKNMALATEESKGSAAALKALGIDFNTFRSMRPDDQMLELAKAMGKFEDGGGKSAAAMALLGKEGAKLLPYLKDLASAGELVATVTTEQADMADRYNDSITESEMRVEALKRTMAMNLLPTMFELHDLTKTMGESLNNYLSKGADNATTKFGAMHMVSSVVGTVFETLLVIGSDLAFVFNGIGRELGGIAAQAAAVLRGDFAQVGEIQKALVLDGKQAREELDKYQSSVLNMTKNVQQATDAVANSTVTSADNSREMRNLLERTNQASQGQVKFTAETENSKTAAKEHAAEIKKQADAYANLTSSLDAKIATSERELSTTGKVTDANKALDKLNADLASGVLKLTDSQIAQTVARINSLDALQRHIEMQKEEKKLQDDISKDMEEVNKQLQSRTDNLVKDNAALAEHNAAIGMDERALVARTAAQLIANAELLEGTAATKDDSGAALAHAGQLTKQAQLLRDRAGLLQSGIIAKEAAEAKRAWEDTTKAIGQGLTDVFMKSITDGKDLWTGFRDYVVNLFKQMVLAPTINTILNPAAQTISNGLQGALGIGQQVAGAITGNGNGNGAGANPTGTLGTIASSVNAATGSVGTAISNTLGSIGSSIGSALGLNSAVPTAAVATTSPVVGGTVLQATELGALTGNTAAASGSAAAGSSALAIAGPIAAAAALFAVANSFRDNNAGVLAQMYDASGANASGIYNQDLRSGQRTELAKWRPTMDALATEYVALAKSLKITPEPGSFGYQESGDSFNLGAFFEGAEYQAGWIPRDAQSVAWAKKRALFAALQASEKPANIAALFDGRNAGLMGFDEINNALAAAAAAPPVGAYAPGQLLSVIQYLRSQGASPADIKAAGLSNFGIAEIYTKGIADAAGIPGFASGGMFGGGLRIVGEHGPEIEATGPSRIFNAAETASMLRSGGATNAELATELAAIRRALERMQLDTKRTADATNGNPEAPMIVEIET